MKFIKPIYFSVFLIPLILNPWAGNEAFETAKQSWFLFFIGLFLLLLLPQIWKSSSIILSVNKSLILVIILWLGSLILSTVFSIAPTESFWGSYKRLQGLFIFLAYAVHFFICLYFFQQERYRKLFFWLTIFTGTIVSLYAIAQGFNIDPLFKGPKGIFTGRSTSTLGSPPSLGQFLIFPWWIALSMAWDNFRKKKKIWIGQLTLLILFSLAIISSFNRASLLGIGIMFVIWAITQASQSKRKWIIATLAVFAVVIIGLSLTPRFQNSKILSLRSLDSRSVLWKSALPLISMHPLLGSGIETSYQTIQKTLSPELYRYERMLDIPDRVHNTLLETLITRGFFGFIILMTTIIWIAFLYKKQTAKSFSLKTSFFALGSYFIAIQFGFSVITHMVFLVALLALFFVESLKFQHKKIRIALTPRIIATLILISTIFVVFNQSYRITKSEYLVNKALKSFFSGNKNASVLFENTWQQLPWYREIPYMTFSLFLEEALENPSVIPVLEKSQRQIEKITNNGFYAHLAQAQLSAALHRYETSWKEFEIASGLAPNWPGIWYKWGKAALKAGDRKMAKEKFEKFLSFAPKYDESEKERQRIFEISNPTYFEVKQLMNTLR